MTSKDRFRVVGWTKRVDKYYLYITSFFSSLVLDQPWISPSTDFLWSSAFLFVYKNTTFKYKLCVLSVMKHTRIEMDDKIHMKFKIGCNKKDITMKEWIKKKIEEEFSNVEV